MSENPTFRVSKGQRLSSPSAASALEAVLSAIAKAMSIQGGRKVRPCGPLGNSTHTQQPRRPLNTKLI